MSDHHRSPIGRWGALLLLLVAEAAFAGPPFQTDDPDPTEFQHYEVYVSFLQNRTEAGVEGTLPQLEINYGAAPDLQLSVAVPLAFNQPASGSGHRGLGDVSFSAKYRFMQETDATPMAAFYPSVTAATGSSARGLGAGASQIFLPIWLQKSWGEWQSYGGGGYLIDHSAGGKNHWFVGWQVQKEFSERLTLGAEIFHQTEGEDGEGSSTGMNLGGSYTFTEHHHLVFSAGRGITNANKTNQFSSYLGYELTW